MPDIRRTEEKPCVFSEISSMGIVLSICGEKKSIVTFY
jgi:hypothetical protein